MIKAASLWHGSYPSIYKDDLDAWLEKHGEPGVEVRRITLSEINPRDIVWPEWEIHDDAVWFEPKKTIIIDDFEAWNADAVNPLMARLNSLSTEFTVALLQHNFAKPIKSVESTLTEEPFDRGIPYENMDDLAEWIIDWLDAHDVTLGRKPALWLAEHCREDVGTVVNVCKGLVAGHAGGKATWDDIEPQLGELGQVPVVDMVKAIVNGDREGALTIARRLASAPKSNPFGPLVMLQNKYRGYLMCMGNLSDEQIMATLNMKSPYALRYIKAEAKQLGRDEAVRAFSLLAKTESDMKGGLALNPWLTMEMTVIQLARGFQVARAR